MPPHKFKCVKIAIVTFNLATAAIPSTTAVMEDNEVATRITSSLYLWQESPSMLSKVIQNFDKFIPVVLRLKNCVVAIF